MHIETGRIVTADELHHMERIEQAAYKPVPMRHLAAAMAAHAVGESLFDAPGGAGAWARENRDQAARRKAEARKRERKQRKAGQRAARRGRK